MTTTFNKKGLVSLIIAISMIAILGIAATLAFFTDEAFLTNSFTMGNVGITLTETTEFPGAEGTPTTGYTFSAIVPGQTISKVPVIAIAEGSLDVYVRAIVNISSVSTEANPAISDADLEPLETTLFSQITAPGTGWTRGEDIEGDAVFYYNASLTQQNLEGTAVSSATLFEEVTIPSTWGYSVEQGTFTISITAQAIQADLPEGAITRAGGATGSINGWVLAPGEGVFEVTTTP